MPRRISTQRGALNNIRDVLLNAAVIIGLVVVTRTFIATPFQVDGVSMVPTLQNNEYIIINKFGYIFGEPKRGDIAVFRPPVDSEKYYVKRIIGLPGDEVIIRDGYVYLVGEEGGKQLIEPYLDERNSGRTFRTPTVAGDTTEARYTVPPDHYFLLGDNRGGSRDSRSFYNAQNEPTPFVHKDQISGRVWLVALPITKSHAIHTPEY